MKSRDIVITLLLFAAVPVPGYTQTACDIAWDPPVQVSRDSSFTTLPELVVSGDTVHLAWIGLDDAGQPGPRYARSTDGGATFSPPAAPLSPYSAYSMHIAADGERVFIVADASVGAIPGIVLLSSTDGGAAWSEPLPVLPAGYPLILFLAGADLLLGFHDNGTSSFGMTRSTDGGQTWSPPVLRMREIADVSIMGGRFHAVGPTIGSSQIETAYYLSADTGRTWSGPAIISPEDLIRSAPSRISVNRRGEIHTAWIDSGAVIYRNSRTSGNSWGIWSPLARGPGCFPLDLASDREFVLAVWGLDTGGVRGIRGRLSSDYGVTFCPEITPGGGDAARDPSLAVKDSVAHLAWIDEDGGFLEVFYRRGILPGGASGNGTPPEAFALLQSFPNPTNGFAYIGFDVPVSAEVTIGIYNVLGELVMRTGARTYEPGRYIEPLEVGGLPSGIYIYRLTAPGFDDFGKMVVLR